MAAKHKEEEEEGAFSMNLTKGLSFVIVSCFHSFLLLRVLYANSLKEEFCARFMFGKRI